MDLIDQNDLSLLGLSKFVLRIYQDKAPICGDFRPSLEKGPGIFFEYLIIRSGNDSPLQDVFSGNILIVISVFRLGGRGYDGLRNLIVLLHTFWHYFPSQGSVSLLILPCGMAGQIAPNDHFYLKWFALIAYCNIGIGGSH